MPAAAPPIFPGQKLLIYQINRKGNLRGCKTLTLVKVVINILLISRASVLILGLDLAKMEKEAFQKKRRRKYSINLSYDDISS